MKKSLRLSFGKFIIFFMFAIFSYTLTVYADVDSVATVQDLQTKVDSAMHLRQTTYSVNYTGNSFNLKTDITNIINNIYNRDDYIKYTSKAYAFSAITTGKLTNIKFNFAYLNTANQDSFVNSRVTQILSEIITPGMNDYEKEKSIHDWIVKNVAYDTTLTKYSDYDGLVSPFKTVCQGYALLAYKMLNKVGIETKIIEGTADGQAHAWNLVNLYGSWYHFDATWDDPVPDINGKVTFDYYNLTDSQIKVNHSWVKKYPLANTDFTDTLNNKLTNDPQKSSVYMELITALELKYLTDQYTVRDAVGLNMKIQESIKNQQNEIHIRYLNDNTLITDLSAAVNEISNITSYSYYKVDYIRSSALGDVILDLNFNYSLPISVRSISLSKNMLTLSPGATSSLTSTVLPSNASNKSVLWSTSNPRVATVGSDGKIHAVAYGTAIISATTAQDSTKVSKCIVTVPMPVIGVSLTKTSATMKIKTSLSLNFVIKPTNVTIKNATWTSSDTSKAKVSSNGTVTAIAAGTVRITVTMSNKSYSSVCTIKITN